VSDHSAQDERRYSRTVKPCGPGTRCWCQVGGGVASPTGFDKTVNPSMTVTRRIRRRGERGVNRKTIRAGRAGVIPVEPVVPTPVLLVAREAMGAIGTRLSLRPLISHGADDEANLGRIARREGEVMSASAIIVPSLRLDKSNETIHQPRSFMLQHSQAEQSCATCVGLLRRSEGLVSIASPGLHRFQWN
jgi:hypothetical protein